MKTTSMKLLSADIQLAMGSKAKKCTMIYPEGKRQGFVLMEFNGTSFHLYDHYVTIKTNGKIKSFKHTSGDISRLISCINGISNNPFTQFFGNQKF